MKDRLRPASHLDHPPPARIAAASSPVAMQTIPNKIDMHLVTITRPVLTKVVEKPWPIGR
jgi:hypothetical protein